MAGSRPGWARWGTAIGQAAGQVGVCPGDGTAEGVLVVVYLWGQRWRRGVLPCRIILETRGDGDIWFNGEMAQTPLCVAVFQPKQLGFILCARRQEDGTAGPFPSHRPVFRVHHSPLMMSHLFKERLGVPCVCVCVCEHACTHTHTHPPTHTHTHTHIYIYIYTYGYFLKWQQRLTITYYNIGTKFILLECCSVLFFNFPITYSLHFSHPTYVCSNKPNLRKHVMFYSFVLHMLSGALTHVILTFASRGKY